MSFVLAVGAICGGKHRVIGARADGTYDVEHAWTSRRAVLRVLAVPGSDEASAERALERARVAASIVHPALVRIHDVERDASGLVYQTEEVVAGPSLAEHLAARPEGRIGVNEALDLLLPIADALVVVHDAGLVHGGLRAQSVLLTAGRGRAPTKLAGLAEAQPIASAELRGPHPGVDSAAFAFLLRASIVPGHPHVDALLDAACDEDPELLPIDLATLVSALAAATRRGVPGAIRSELDQREREQADPGGGASRTGSARARRIRFGVVDASLPLDDPRLVRDLSNALDMPARFVRYRAYGELVVALAEGRVDVAWLAPLAYARARRAGIAIGLCALRRQENDSFGSALLARVDRVRSFRDVIGKRAAWVDPWSAAGYVVPRSMLRRRGIDPDRCFSAEAFLSSHEAVLEALLSDRADVGASWCALGLTPHGPWLHHPQVHVLDTSGELPPEVLCASPTVLDATPGLATRLVTSMGSDLARALGLEGFDPHDDARYEALALELAPEGTPRAG